MSKKTWIIIAVIVVGVFGFFLVRGKPAEQTPATHSNADPKKVVTEDYISGSPAKKIVVMEYLDFQCPGCRNLYPTMKEVMVKYKNQVTFVHRYFPLTSIHPNAMTAARAGEAAGKQGKFFEMEDLLFTNQDAWGTLSTSGAQKALEGYAQQLSLNMEKFKQDFASAATLSRVNADRDKGNKMGVTGTPTVFLNGEKVEIKDEGDVAKAIDTAIKDNKTDPVNAQAN